VSLDRREHLASCRAGTRPKPAVRGFFFAHDGGSGGFLDLNFMTYSYFKEVRQESLEESVAKLMV
jgi:hypothetical protein